MSSDCLVFEEFWWKDVLPLIYSAISIQRVAFIYSQKREAARPWVSEANCKLYSVVHAGVCKCRCGNLSFTRLI